MTSPTPPKSRPPRRAWLLAFQEQGATPGEFAGALRDRIRKNPGSLVYQRLVVELGVRVRAVNNSHVAIFSVIEASQNFAGLTIAVRGQRISLEVSNVTVTSDENFASFEKKVARAREALTRLRPAIAEVGAFFLAKMTLLESEK